MRFVGLIRQGLIDGRPANNFGNIYSACGGVCRGASSISGRLVGNYWGGCVLGSLDIL